MLGFAEKHGQKQFFSNDESPKMKILKRDYTWHLLNHITYLIKINTPFLSKEWDIYSISHSLENKGVDGRSKNNLSFMQNGRSFQMILQFSLVKNKNIIVVIYIVYNYIYIYIYIWIWKNLVTFNQVMAPIAKISFLESIRGIVEDLIY